MRALLIGTEHTVTEIEIHPERANDDADTEDQFESALSAYLHQPTVEFDTRPDGFCLVQGEQYNAEKYASINAVASILSRGWQESGEGALIYGPAIVLGSSSGADVPRSVEMDVTDTAAWTQRLMGGAR